MPEPGIEFQTEIENVEITEPALDLHHLVEFQLLVREIFLVIRIVAPREAALFFLFPAARPVMLVPDRMLVPGVVIGLVLQRTQFSYVSVTPGSQEVQKSLHPKLRARVNRNEVAEVGHGSEMQDKAMGTHDKNRRCRRQFQASIGAPSM